MTRPENDFDARDFRRALGAFVTGVTVVTAVSEGKPVGFTANSFTSVSLDPPLVLVCLGKTSSNFPAFAETESFAINILAEQQRDVSRNFATKGIDRFASVPWTMGAKGNPLVDESSAWFECETHQRVDAGDHIILIGRVRAYGHNTFSPLGFCRGNYVLFQLEQEIAASTAENIKVGALIEAPSGIVLLRDSVAGKLRLPYAKKIGSREANDGLYGTLSGLGLSFDIDFLYSVYDDENKRVLNVYYRGQASADPVDGPCRVFPLEAIPFEELEDDALRMLLTRYVEERAEYRFSVYSGNEVKGDLWKLGEG